jgi:hypothetical protein
MVIADGHVDGGGGGAHHDGRAHEDDVPTTSPESTPASAGSLTALRTCVRMGDAGSAYARFQRALATGNLALIHAAASELPQVDLGDALAVSTEQVVQAADGCLSAEGLVSSAMVVLEEPAVKGAGSFV